MGQLDGRSWKPFVTFEFVFLELKSTLAAAGAVDREFNYNFGSNLGPGGSGSGLKRRGVSAKLILAGFGLKRSHGDPFRDQNCGFGIG